MNFESVRITIIFT